MPPTQPEVAGFKRRRGGLEGETPDEGFQRTETAA